ncbi:MAG: type IV secretion system DNA-binding domain-containing protein [Candidatus Saccharibacteria bacterium]
MDIIITIFSTLIQIVSTVLFKFWGWVFIAGWLFYLIKKNNQKVSYIERSEHTMLQIIVPKDNEKKELSAEQLFASLHGILQPASDNEGIQEHISFEIVSHDHLIYFYVWCPRHLKDYVESQVYAQYPSIQITEMDSDYSRKELDNRNAYSTEVVLSKNEIFPIKTFATFEVDPLAGLTTVLASLGNNEEMWIQILAEPVSDSWHSKSLSYVDEVRNGKKKGVLDGWISAPGSIIKDIFTAFFTPDVYYSQSAKSAAGPGKKELSPGQTTSLSAIEAKAEKLGYAVKIRICYIGDNEQAAKQRIQALIGGFKQFNTVNLNGFEGTPMVIGDEGLKAFQNRTFEDSGFILNIEELASVFHLPHTSVETPNIAYTSTKVGEPPALLPTLANTKPEDISLFGATTFRQGEIKFGIKRKDRERHLYIIGKSGVGKSFLLNLLTLSDIYQNEGFAVVDPHGDYAQDIMKYIPENRINDVIYINPDDADFPVAFNPMEYADESRRNNIASEIVGVLKKMFGDSWGPRLEHILRFTLLALLETPGTTMLGITRMLTDKNYRKSIVDNIKDPVVKAFWITEFASWNDKFAAEAVQPVLNKVGAFTAVPLVRNIIGQPKSSFNIRNAMDEGKIIIVNLSRGKIGEDNAAILGSLIITKIQLDAMSRADVSNIEERRPFYLYVDEFQNFATESFAVILSEARKYGLRLTVANQYVSQMPEEVRDAVFGNVGSMVTFRVGADDADYLSKYFTPVFEPIDLVNLDKQNIYVSMSIDGQTSSPFSGKSLLMPSPSHDYTERIIENSRSKYSMSRSDVEDLINDWAGASSDSNKTNESAQGARSNTGYNNHANTHKDNKQDARPPQNRPEIAGVEPKRYSDLIKNKNNKSNHYNKPRRNN